MMLWKQVIYSLLLLPQSYAAEPPEYDQPLSQYTHETSSLAPRQEQNCNDGAFGSYCNICDGVKVADPNQPDKCRDKVGEDFLDQRDLPCEHRLVARKKTPKNGGGKKKQSATKSATSSTPARATGGTRTI